MSAAPLPAADVLPIGPGTAPQGSASGTAPDDGLNASEFAALLQEAGLAAEGLPSDERTESAPEVKPEGVPAEPVSASAFDGLLFLATLNAPAVAPKAAPPSGPASAAIADSLPTGTVVLADAASLAGATGDVVDRHAARGAGAQFLASSSEAAKRAERQSGDVDVATDIVPRAAVAERSSAQMPALFAAFPDASARKAESLTAEAKSAPVSAASDSTLVAAPATPFARPSVSVEIPTPVHDPAWRAEAMGRIATLVTRGVDHAQLRLSPAELGPVEVRIDVRGGETTLAIVATQAATRDALEQALPLLREMLSQQGLSLGEASVRDGRADGGANRDESSAGRAATPPRFDALATEVPSVTRAALIRRLVDVFA